MDIRIDGADLDLRRRARAFTDEVLVPLELECDERDGLSPESAASAKQAVLDRGFAAINQPREDGGQGLDVFQQMLVEEQWGRATGGLWAVAWRPALPLARATAEQRERYLRPACRGDGAPTRSRKRAPGPTRGW